MSGPVLIVGAGLAGLAAAWHLRRAGIDVRVLEAAERVGGVIRTLRHDGVLLEQGPQSLRAGGPGTADILAGLGLTGDLVPASTASRTRYLLLDGRLAPLPSGPAGLLGTRALPLPSVLRALAEPLQPRGDDPEESIAAFIARRFGRRVADPLLDAFIAGIYAGDASRVEAAAAFPALVQAEREHGSVILGMLRRERPDRPDWLPRGSFTFTGGVQQLVDALDDALGDVVVRGRAVRRIVEDGAGWRVEHDDGVDTATRVILAAPPWAAAPLVDGWTEVFEAIPAAPIAAVHLGWPSGEGPAQQGFGWLAPTSERRDCLGTIFVSSTFPHLAPGHDLVRVMIGGSRAPDLADLPQERLVEHALGIVREVQGDVSDPALRQVARHRPGIPQYVRGHGARRRALQAREGLDVLGWGVTGIGLAQGLEAARDLAGAISGTPAPPGGAPGG